MNLVTLLRDEGYSRVSYLSEGKKHHLVLDKEEDTNFLLKWLDQTPYAIEYFPYEVKPYVMCLKEEQSLKLFLYK